jgi:hypothetical protein
MTNQTVEASQDAARDDFVLVRTYVVRFRRELVDRRWTGSLLLSSQGQRGGSTTCLLDLPRRYRSRRGLLRAARRYAERHRAYDGWGHDQNVQVAAVQ